LLAHGSFSFVLAVLRQLLVDDRQQQRVYAKKPLPQAPGLRRRPFSLLLLLG
jgi:hypothetical protein